MSLMIVKLCTLVAMTSQGTKQIVVDGLRFKTHNATDVYRCEYVNRNDLNALLRERGIKRYKLKPITPKEQMKWNTSLS